MNGDLSLYLHIPFCKRKCPYCHFYVTADKEDQKKPLTDALLLEWERIRPFVASHRIVSIYFGGGTPSLLGANHLSSLLTTFSKEASLASDCEITLETNPEQTTLALMQDYKAAGVNRLSIGIQSLDDASLVRLGRNHKAETAKNAILTSAQAGFTNLSIDLMYDLPDQSVASFVYTLNELQDLPITHVSLYNLTIEPGTSFHRKQATLHLPSDAESLALLNQALYHLGQMGFERYEISAFAKPSFRSKHNLGYWHYRPFFGLGPSAFSYYEGRRFRNSSHLAYYIKAMHEGRSAIDFEEKLEEEAHIRERLCIELRVLSGIDLSSFPVLSPSLEQEMASLIRQNYVEKQGQHVRLTEKGTLFYDTVASSLI